MATEIGKLYYDLEVDDKKLKSGLDSADKQVQGFGSKVDAFGDRMTSAGKKMSLGLTLPITALATYGVKAFSDLGEAVNAVSVVFGESSKKLEEFANTASTQVGLSKRAFLQAATPIGAALQNVGYSAEEAADKSIVLTKRAADMASVFNVDVSEALTAINAGLRGESEPIKRFGVGLDEASIKAYALANGIAKQGEEMTNAQKVQARYGLLMEQSNKVSGDFVNTSDSIANSQRIMKAQTEDTAAKLAENFAPAVQKAQGEMLKLLERFNALSPAQQEMILKGIGVIAVLGPLTTAIGALAKAAMFAYASLTPLAAVLAVGGVAAILNFKNATDNADTAMGKMRTQMQGLGFDTSMMKGNVDSLKLSQDFLKQSTEMVKLAQDSLAASTNNLANAELGLEGASLRVEQAQLNYTNAVKQFGPDSLQARQANLELKSAQQGVKDAADLAKKAQEEKGKAESELAKKKELENTTRSATEALKDQAGWFDKLGERAKKAGISNTLYGGMKTPGFAEGVNNFRGGMAVVGEKGPELVNLPKGSDVIPNDKIRDISNKPQTVSPTVVGGGGDTYNFNFSGMAATSKQSLRDLSQEIFNAFNEGLRSQGKKEVGTW